MARGGKRSGAGRKRGSINARTREIEAYARRIVQDAEVVDVLFRQAKEGTLPTPLMQMFFYYAFGKPYERVQVEGVLDAGEGLAALLRPAGSQGHASD